jgi:hypothetical protein
MGERWFDTFSRLHHHHDCSGPSPPAAGGDTQGGRFGLVEDQQVDLIARLAAHLIIEGCWVDHHK